MKINEFAEKYGVSKRSIDYWTNVGLLHPDGTSEGNGYRIYGPTAEEEIKKILIAQAMGGSPLEEYVDMLDHLPKQLWNTVVIDGIEREIQRVIASYKLALNWAKEIGDQT